MALAAIFTVTACGGDDGEPSPDAGPSLVGSLRVHWNLVDGTGVSRTCADYGFQTVAVAIGREPVEAACDQGSLLFENLLASRYPVLVQVKLGPTVVAEARGNADVAGGAEATFNATLTITAADLTKGAVKIAWRIDGRLPATACASVGADHVRVSTLPGSIESFSRDVPCTDGEVTVMSLRPGLYDVLLHLEDANNTRLATTATGQFRINAGETYTTPLIGFSTTGPLLPAKLLAEWTISGSVAASGCAGVGAETVRVEAIGGPMMTTLGSTTADCPLGRVLLGGLNPGTYRVRVSALDFLPDVLTATTVRNVELMRGRTATVTVNLF